MNKNELNKIREMSDVELVKKLDDLKEELFHGKYDRAVDMLVTEREILSNTKNENV